VPAVLGTNGLAGFGIDLARDDATVIAGGLLTLAVDGAMALLGWTCRRRDDDVDWVD